MGDPTAGREVHAGGAEEDGDGEGGGADEDGNRDEADEDDDGDPTLSLPQHRQWQEAEKDADLPP